MLYDRGVGTGPPPPPNFSAGSTKVTKLIKLDVATVAALIKIHLSASSGLCNLLQYFADCKLGSLST